MSDPCRTIHLPHPGHIAPDVEDFLADHMLVPDGRLLPLDGEPWNLSFNLRRGGRSPRCEACGNFARGGVLLGMRHRRAPSELWCCRRCALVLNGAAPDVIAAESAKPEHPETAACRRYVDRLRDTSTWSSPFPGVQIVDPDPFARIALDGRGEGWTWRVQVRFGETDRENIAGTAATIEQAYTEAGWAWSSADRVRMLVENQRAGAAHAEACAAVEHVRWMADEVEGFRRLPAHRRASGRRQSFRRTAFCLPVREATRNE